MASNELSQDDIDALLNRAAERARVAGDGVPSAAPAFRPKPAAPAYPVAVPAAAPVAAPATPLRPTAPSSGPAPTRGSVSTVETAGVFEDIMDIPLQLRIRLGEAVMPIEDVVGLREGSVVELDRASGDPVDVMVNNRVIARGEVVVVDDRFTVRLTEILAPVAR